MCRLAGARHAGALAGVRQAAESVAKAAARSSPAAAAAVLGRRLRTTAKHAAALLEAFVDEDLTVPQHRHITAAARTLLEQGHPIDAVTVMGHLRRQGTENARTDSRDAGALLVELCQAARSVTSASHNLRVVLEHAYRRRAQQTATRLLRAAETGPLTALHDLIEREHTAPIPAHCRIIVHLPQPAPVPGSGSSRYATPKPPDNCSTAMPETRPDLTGPVDRAAVVVIACPLLPAHLTALQPGLRTALLPRLARIGTPRDRDGLLLVLGHRRARATRPGHHDGLPRH